MRRFWNLANPKYEAFIQVHELHNDTLNFGPEVQEWIAAAPRYCKHNGHNATKSMSKDAAIVLAFI